MNLELLDGININELKKDFKKYFYAAVKKKTIFKSRNLAVDFLLAKGYSSRNETYHEIKRLLTKNVSGIIRKLVKEKKIEKYNSNQYYKVIGKL